MEDWERQIERQKYTTKTDLDKAKQKVAATASQKDKTAPTEAEAA